MRKEEVSAVDRLHKLCDKLQELQEDSPYSKEAWDGLDAENERLRAELKQLRRGYEECSYELFELKKWLEEGL